MAGPLEDAEAAYVRHDYEAAMQIWQPLANQGDAEAQYALGSMYHMGRGMPQRNFAEALKWWRKAADQGHAGALSGIACMYVQGQGVPQDYVQAFLWIDLAAAYGSANAAEARDLVAQRMTPEQVAEALRLAREWLAAHPKQ